VIRTITLILCLALVVELTRLFFILCIVSSAADRVLEIRIPATGPAEVARDSAATQPAWLPEITDLSNVLKANGSDILLKPKGSYHLNGLFPAISGTLKLTGDDTDVHYGGPLDAVLFDLTPAAHDVTIQGVHWINDHPTPDHEQANNPIFMRPSGKSITVRGCTFDGFDHVFLAEVAPAAGLLVEHCSTTDLRGCFFYGAVDGATFAYCTVPNSTRQEAVRIEGSKRVRFYRCDFQDQDNRALGDPNDRGKSPIRDHVSDGDEYDHCTASMWGTTPDGKYVRLETNSFDIGPESGNSNPATTSGDRAANVSIHDCDFFVAGVGGGVQNLTIDHCRVGCSTPAAFMVLGYDAKYHRTVDSVSITNNLIWSDAAQVQVIFLKSGAKNVVVQGNVVVAPNLVSSGNYDALQILVDDAAPFPVSFKANVFQLPQRYGWPGNTVARLGADYLTTEQFIKLFPGNTFGNFTEAQAAAAGAGVRP
jgi:hypothetical protein